MDRELIGVSKFLSLVLRHQPEVIGLELDPQGWADVEELLRLANEQGRGLDLRLLKQVVAANDKQRFSFDDGERRIRANQGHSIPVELGLEPQTPPALLFHGTVGRFLDSIREDGIRRGARHHVHLSPDAETATIVGKRRAAPLVLTIRSEAMHQAGHTFYVSENGVWLTEHVPPAFIDYP